LGWERRGDTEVFIFSVNVVKRAISFPQPYGFGMQRTDTRPKTFSLHGIRGFEFQPYGQENPGTFVGSRICSSFFRKQGRMTEERA
jgi:hypothetical protein